MVYALTKVGNFREPYFRSFSVSIMLENKGVSHGSWLRKLPPPPITPTPLRFAAARELRRCAALPSAGRTGLTAMAKFW